MSDPLEQTSRLQRLGALVRRAFSVGLRCLAWWSLAFGVLGALAQLLQRWWWPLENVAAFRVQWLVMLVFATGYWAWRRRWVLAVASLASAVVPVASLAPLYSSPASPAPIHGTRSQRLRVLFANVLSSNRHARLVIDYVAASDAQIVVLAEVTPAWLAALAPLRSRYPHWLHRARSDNFGIALLSRLPIRDGRVVALAPGAGPSVIARFRLPGTRSDLTVMGVHLFPPVSSFSAKQRDFQSARLARFTAAARQRVIVVGDFNMTDSSPAFGRLLEKGNLRDSRRGFGVQATWPVWAPLLLVPLDHALVSPDLSVVTRRVGPDVGSDHYPLVIDIAIPLASRPASTGGREVVPELPAASAAGLVHDR